MSDGEYDGYEYDPGYEDTGAGYQEPEYVNGFRTPEGGHWSTDEDWVRFADALMTAFQNSPADIEGFYGQYAAMQGLRGLAEAVEAAAQSSPKRGGQLMSKELRHAAEEFLRNGREQR
jgi:hypothetical protein